jgi:hypothetical protein
MALMGGKRGFTETKLKGAFIIRLVRTGTAVA